MNQVAAEPYETIAFRIPAREIEDESDDAGFWNWSHWDPDTHQYSFQFMYVRLDNASMCTNPGFP
jgi:splicing factor 3A subunit 2